MELTTEYITALGEMKYDPTQTKIVFYVKNINTPKSESSTDTLWIQFTDIIIERSCE